MRPGRTRGIAVAVVLLVGSLAPASTLAGGDSFEAEFSTPGGNEWWIEVYVDANEPLDAVAVSIDDGPWRALEHKDWGAWAASYHAPEGSTVEFRATSSDGETVHSQAYHWPSGDPVDGSSDEGTFEAEFSTPGGNEWWIEVYVDANKPLDAVSVSVDGDPWRPLEEKDWGAYAGSYHAPEGSIVEFRAVAPKSDSVESQPYHWPSGEPVNGGGSGGGTSDGFAADFSTPGGNEWWIEVYVDADESVTSVATRIDGGEWKPLEHEDWGAWAASYHAPEGSTVEFRATSSDGDTALSSSYRWTSGEEIAGEDGSSEATRMDAAFGPKAGNEWWVETYVVADARIEQVEARADGGAWHELEYRDWGAWAASFHVPHGSEVEFRAENETGAVDASERFGWPDAAPADDPDAAWPHRGSYADYTLHGGGPGGNSYEIEAVYVHDGDGWVVRCQGYREDPNGREQVFDYAELPPPEGPSNVRVGQQVDVEKGGCHRGTYDLTVLEKRGYDTRRDGEQVTVSTWFANRTDDCNCLGWEAYWETETDIVTEWWRGGRSGDVGELEDTDAPMSEG